MDDLQTLAHSDGVSAHRGFPNPALESRGRGEALALDINRLLIRQASSTYLFRISGHRWADQGIFDGDIAVVDRALQAGAGDMLIAWEDGDARLCRQHQLTDTATPWGVVTSIIHQYRPHQTLS